MSLTRYKCHKIVEAAKILEIEYGRMTSERAAPNDSVMLVETKVGNMRLPFDPAWMGKHNPKVGGYYVKYQDGYDSYSPADAFEDGYTEVGEG